MARMPVRGGLVGALGVLAAWTWLALPGSGAVAAPASPVLPWRYSGWLGKSGLFVKSTPQSLLVLRVASQSPADLAGIAGPAHRPSRAAKGVPTEGEVLRILAINGRHPAELSARELAAAFNPGTAPRVAIVLGRRGPSDIEETREGPVLVDLVPPGSVRAYQHAAARRWRKALEAAGRDPEIRAGVVARMLFDAQQRALEGEMARALEILAMVPREDPGHARAVELYRQYESVTRQARRPD